MMRTSALGFGALALALSLAAPCGTRAQERPAPRNPHLRLGDRACTACHTTTDWATVRFDHRTTAFPLLGQHQAVPCAACHDLRDFRGAATACASCHADPHRGDAGRRCEQCHAETGWQAVSAQNAHARTRLPDLGVHAALRCDDCHRQTGAQQFSGRVAPCVACHRAAYDATSTPPHRTLGFQTQCEACHQFTTWSFALFAGHDAIFPVYSGGHAGRWQTCANCHTDATDYHTFTCTTCHGQARTDAAHQGISGYQWVSSACLTCHPDGSSGGFGQHDAVFPIFSGAHSGHWNACADCHTDPSTRRVYSCMTGTCHPAATTDGGHQGIPGYAYVAAQCLACHPAGARGTFTQHDALFPIYSGSHAARWSACSDCHTDPATRASFSCMTGACHPKADVDSHHGGIAGYQYVAAQCYACHPQGRTGGLAPPRPVRRPPG